MIKVIEYVIKFPDGTYCGVDGGYGAPVRTLNKATFFVDYGAAETKLIDVEKNWHKGTVDYSQSQILKKVTILYNMEEELEDE